MQYTKEMADKVMRGEKTQTRRRGKPRYKKGSRQPIQCGYRDKARGYVIIDEVRPQPLGEITHEEAITEGFKTIGDFFAYMAKIHKKYPLDFNEIYTVYEFHLEEPK